jgi:alkanesulfonate monooxygenase SsuD/methylene tetrahydromethanopterin reductase-like flavin-dependent oxidoreductase (luciferase family)
MILRTGWRAERSEVSPASSFAAVIQEGRAAAQAGITSFYAYDHLEAIPDEREAPFFEAWTTLAAAAAALPAGSRVGTLVSGVSLRNVGLLAKQAVTIDAATGGHAILGLGAGWYRDELRRYGIPVATFAERVANVEAAIGTIRGLWSGRPVTSSVGASRFDDAIGSPRPVAGDIPIWVGGNSAAMKQLAVRHADGINIGGTVDEVAAGVTEIEEGLEREGRDRGGFTVSIEVQVARDPGADDLQRIASRSGTDPKDFATWNLVGDAETIRRRAQLYRSAGVDEVVAFLPLARDDDDVARLAELICEDPDA